MEDVGLGPGPPLPDPKSRRRDLEAPTHPEVTRKERGAFYPEVRAETDVIFYGVGSLHSPFPVIYGEGR